MPHTSRAGEMPWKQKDLSPGILASNTGFDKRLSTESILNLLSCVETPDLLICSGLWVLWYSTVIVIPFEGKISQIFFATIFCVVHPWERFGKQISLPGVLARWYATFSPDMSKSRWYTFPVIPPLNLLKVVSVTFLVVCFLSLKENSCETWKKFYFTSKAFFIPQKIKF